MNELIGKQVYYCLYDADNKPKWICGVVLGQVKDFPQFRGRWKDDSFLVRWTDGVPSGWLLSDVVRGYLDFGQVPPL